MIGLSPDGINIINQSATSPYFNFTGGDFAQSTSWIGANTGFLVLPNAQGEVLSGQQLIDGFAQLIQLNGGSTIIDTSDPLYAQLRVWVDQNGDGVAQPGELYTLASLGVQSLSLVATAADTPVGDSTMVDQATVTMADGSARAFAAVELNASATYTQYVGPVQVIPAAQALPYLHGYGSLPGLWVQMSADPTLLSLVSTLASTDPLNTAAFDAALQAVMYEWAGVSAVSPLAGGLSDGQKLAFLRAITGDQQGFYLDPIDSTPFFVGQANEIQVAWDQAFAGVKANILTQLPGSPYAAAFTYDEQHDMLWPTASMPASIEALAAAAPADPTAAQAYWTNALLLVDQSSADLGEIGLQDAAATEAVLAAALPAQFTPTIIAAAATGTLSFVEGSELNNQLVGSLGSDLVDITTSNTTFTGFGGGDEIFVGPGLGVTRINEVDDSANPDNVLVLGSGIEESNIIVTVDKAGDVTLNLGGGNSVVIDNMLGGPPSGYQQATLHNAIPYGPNTHFGVQAIYFADGTQWSVQQVVQAELADATTGADVLIAPFGAYLFDGKGGRDYEQAAGGNDTFVFDQGYGALEINETDTDTQGNNVLQLGSGITPASLTVKGTASGDIVIADGIAGDQITIDGMQGGQNGGTLQGVQSVVFADGMAWSAAQVLQMAVTGSPTNTQLYGAPSPEVFNSNGFATYAQGQSGADTFIYDAGYGNLEINEDAGPAAVSTAVLELGSGISEGQLAVSNDSQGDVILTDGVMGDEIKLDGEALTNTNGQAEYGVGSVVFADGTVLTRAQLLQMESEGASNGISLYGTSQPRVFDGLGRAAYEQGESDADTFVYDVGYGHQEISEFAGYFSVSTAVLQFGPGITENSLKLGVGGNDDLIVTDGTPGDQIQIDNETNVYYTSLPQYGVATFEFADGSSLNLQQILNLLTTGGPGNTRLYGTEAPGVFDSKGYANYENGISGSDTFIYDAGYGKLEIDETSGAGASVLAFGSGIAPSNISVTANQWGDLIIGDGTPGDEITLDGEIPPEDYISTSGPSPTGVATVTFANGTTWTAQQLIAAEVTGASTSSELIGGTDPQTFDPKGHANYLDGQSGEDTFVYEPGYGAVEIVESAVDGGADQGVLAFGAGISQSSITVTADASGDIYIGDGVAGDVVKLDGEMTGAVAAVTFADGSSLSQQQLVELALTGSPTNRTLISADLQGVVFNSDGYATSETGSSGDDTFVYDQGYGSLQITENGYDSSGGLPEIQFGPGITPGSLTVTSDGTNLYVSDGVAGDQIEVVDGAVTEAVFSNGASASLAQLAGVVPYGVSQVFDGKGQVREEAGFGGNDTFIYDAGYGNLSISESGTDGVLDFGSGITQSQIMASLDSSGDLILSDGVPGDVITIAQEDVIDTYDNTYYSGVSEVEFADGTSLDRAQLLAMAPPVDVQSATASGGANEFFDGGVVYGPGAPVGSITMSSGVITFESGDLSGQNAQTYTPGTGVYDQGGGGADTFVYVAGEGPLEIDEPAGATGSTTVLLVGVSPARLSVTLDQGGDFILTNTADGDQITLDDGIGGSTTVEFYQPTGSSESLASALSAAAASGTALTTQQLIDLATQGAGVNGVLNGPTAMPVVFDSKGLATRENGYNGADTFIYDQGYGALEIDEYETNALSGSTTTNAVLQFGPGIVTADLTVTQSGWGNLVIEDGVPGDEITIDGVRDYYGGSAWNGLGTVTFQDGQTLTEQQLIDLSTTGASSISTLWGGLTGTLFAPTSPVSIEQGQSGADTFVYDAGSGSLEISEELNASVIANASVLQLGPGITPSQISVTGGWGFNLYIADGVAGDVIQLDDELNSQTQGYIAGAAPTYGVSEVEFANGTVLTRQQLIDLATTGSPTNRILHGGVEPAVINPLGYATNAEGESGQDTFIYDAGDGNFEFSEQAPNGAASGAVLQLGAGITPSRLNLSIDAAGDITVTDGVPGDSLIIDDEDSGWDAEGVAQVNFADGTVLSGQQLVELAATGSSTQSTLYGGPAASVFDPRGYATYAQAESGADTFIYDQGYGRFEIHEDPGQYSSTSAVLQFGAGITAAQLGVTIDDAGNLILTDGITGDEIIIDGEANLGPQQQAEFGVASVQFADGTILTRQQLLTMTTTGSAGNTRLYGTSDEIFDSKGEANYEQAIGYADTFVYDSGYGPLEIRADSGVASSSTSILQFGPGITASGLTVTVDTAGDLIVSDGVSGDLITLDGEVDLGPSENAEYGVGAIDFSDGSSLNRQQLINLLTTGSPTHTSLYGLPGADTFFSNGYASYEQGNGGADTFIYDQAYGALEINENNGPQNASTAVIQFGAGIAASSLTVSFDSAGDMILTDGVAGDQITVDKELDIGPDGQPQYGVTSVDFADGTALTRQQLIDKTLVGSPGHTTLVGPPGADTFDSQGYATLDVGSGGADTFIYDQGYGTLEIDETGSSGGPSQAVLQFGAGVTPSDLSATTDEAGNLILTDGATGDQVTLEGELNSVSQGVGSVTFADGTTLTRQQLVQLETTGSPNNVALYGGPLPEVFNSDGYASYYQGNSGADTFVYDPGYGTVVIGEDAGQGQTSSAVLQFGAGITESQISVTADSAGDIFITDGVYGDQLELGAELDTGTGFATSNSEYGVAEVTFANGTVLTSQQLIEMETTGSPTNTSLYGSPGAEVFDSKGYATYEQGNGGQDTFVYNAGYGGVTIDEVAGPSAASTAILSFGSGISETDVTATSDGSGDLILTDGVTGDQIVVTGELNPGAEGQAEYGVAQATFADGTTLDRQQLIDLITTGAPGKTALFGTNGPAVFDSKGFSSFAEGYGGADTFVYDPGYGALEISEEASPGVSSTAVLAFGAGVAAAGLSATVDGAGDLIITDQTTGDSIQLDGQLVKDGSGLFEGGVESATFADGTTLDREQLYALAMSSYTASDSTLTLTPYQGVEIEGGADTVIAGSTNSVTVAASGTVVSGTGAAVTVLSGGVIASGVLSDGGQLTISAGGAARGLDLSSGATEFVQSGGLSQDVTLSAGGVANIASGGSTAGDLIDGGSEVLLSGASASAASVSAGGILTVSSGGSATQSLIAGGTESVLSGGLDSGSVVGGGGVLRVSSGGVTSGVTVSSGATEVVLSGGLAENTIVLSGGSISFADGADIISATLEPGVTQTLLSGAVISGAIVSSGSVLTVQSGAIVSGAIILSGGLETVQSGGVAQANTVDVGGAVNVASGASTSEDLIQGGTETVDRGTVSNAVVSSGGALAASSGGLAIDTQVLTGGVETVQAGGRAQTTTVGAGGSVIVASGGETAGDLIEGGGSEALLSGGAGSGAVIASEGAVVVSSGGVAIAAAVGSGGTINDGGLVVSASVSSGGSVTVSSGGETLGDDLQAGAVETILGGGLASQASVAGGTLQVSSGGVASSAAIGSGGTLAVAAGGSAAATQVDSSGSVVVSSGGSTVDDDVLEGATETVLSGGVGSAISINGGALAVLAAGLAAGSFVGSGGEELIASGASATSATVGSGGQLIVSSGGAAADVWISSGGTVQTASGASVSSLVVSAGGSLGGGAGLSGLVVVSSGASVSGAAVTSSATEIFYSGATQTGLLASGATIEWANFAYQGGTQSAFSSSSDLDSALTAQAGFDAELLSATVMSGAKLTISSGATVIDTQVDLGGVVALNSGAIASGGVVSSGGILSGGGLLAGSAVDGGLLSGLAIVGSVDLEAGGLISGGAIRAGAVVSGGGVVAGGTVVGTLENVTVAGGVVLSSGGAEVGVTVASAETLSSGAIASSINVEAGGTVRLLSGALIEGNTVDSGVVESGIISGTFDLLSGGILTQTTIAAGATVSGPGAISGFVTDFGVISGTVVEESLILSSGASAYATTVVSGAGMRPQSGSTASDLVVQSGGTVDGAGTLTGTIEDAGLVESATIDGTVELISGGDVDQVFIAQGGVVSGSGGTLAFTTDDGLIDSATVSGGVVSVGSGGVLENGAVISGAHVTMVSGGLAEDEIVSSGGQMEALAGAVLSGGSIEAGGTLFGGGVVEGGVTDGGLVSGVIIAGELAVQSGGVVSGLVVSAGGDETVALGGMASSVVIKSGGTEVLLSGGQDLGTIVSGSGAAVISSGGVTDNIMITSGGSLLDDGSAIFAPLSGASAYLSGYLSGSGMLTENGPGMLVIGGSTAGFTGALVISGGVAVLSVGDSLESGEVDFQPGSATATLKVSSADLPSPGRPEIDDFDNTLDGIDLPFAYSSAITAVLNGSTLVVTNASQSYDFNLGGSFASSFSVTSDGAGGTLITPAYTLQALVFAHAIGTMAPEATATPSSASFPFTAGSVISMAAPPHGMV